MKTYSKKEKIMLEVLNKTEEKNHFHQDIELLYVLDGTMEVMVSEKKTKLKAEDVLVINANKMHGIKASKDILYVKISIVYETVSDIVNHMNVVFWCDSTREDSQKYGQLRRMLRLLLNKYYSSKNSMRSFGYIACAYQILEFLSAEFLVKRDMKEEMSESEKYDNRIEEISNYVRLNYNQPISMKELSEQLYLSIGYLSRFFKKNFGMNFTDYLNQIRLFYAVDELLYTDNPITRVAYDNGFVSVAAFNKAFKEEYKETPSAVRKRSGDKKKEEKEKNIVDDRIEKIIWNLKDDAFEKKEKNEICEQVANEEWHKLRPIWCKAINMGSAEDLLKSEIREHMLLLKQALKFEYVRFWSPFTTEMFIDINNGEGIYNFSSLDSVFDFILEQGMKPHIELATKPKRVQKNTKTALIYEEKNHVNSIENYERLVDHFVRHIIKRYGYDEVKQWRMELWDESGLANDKEKQNAYFMQYKTVYEIVKKYCPELEIGGSGIPIHDVTGTEHSYMESFCRKYRELGIQMDFISFMSYAYAAEEIDQVIYSRQSNDKNFTQISMDKMIGTLEKYHMKDVKCYITEWNFTISDRNYINDTCYKAAYIVSNYISMYGKAEEMDYFHGTDRMAEYYDSNELLYGGNGLITRNGILKPSAFAFDFLNQLFPYFLQKGNHYIITTDNQDNYAIVCHNCRELSYNYYATEEDKLEKERMYKYYEDMEMLKLNLKIQNLEDGVYKVRKYQINEQCGSVLDLWGQMGYEMDISRNDIKYFRRACEPKLYMQNIEIKKNAAEVDILLQPNEIALIKLIKKD